MTVPPLQLIVGPPGHGVVAYAADLGSAVRALDAQVDIAHVESVGEAVKIAHAVRRTHLHVTDRLLGGSPEEAARNVEHLAAQTRLTITLHDVPQASDGSGLERRVAAYSRILAAAQGTVVNSRHEQLLVAEFLLNDGPPHAIPLGTRRAVPPGDGAKRGQHPADTSVPQPLVVLIAGYIYPGKGHSQAITAGADAARIIRHAGEAVGSVVVRAIGRPSAGHERDVELLRAHAERSDVHFEVTGFLEDADFASHIIADGIPLAAHEHVSASRSMLDWVEAGRRPLVISSRYAQEMAILRPGTMALYEPADLPRRLVAAWRAPGETWLNPGTRLAPTLDDAAAEYLEWWNAMDTA